ncbi:MAG: phosphate ABC transporter ATP-binding protein PstB [Bacteroidota bacterium]
MSSTIEHKEKAKEDQFNDLAPEAFKIEAINTDVFYGQFHAIKNVSIGMKENSVTAFIGPSGCGKSTFLRLFNRMNDYIDSFSMKGIIKLDGKEITGKKVDVEQLRKDVGMVFQKPNPFPKSIYNNVSYGLKIQGIKDKAFINERVQTALTLADLWNEVKDNLKKPALALSGGQQQRLCIARTLAVEPSVILMDEPTSALDPISTAKIEDLIFQLREKYTIVIVTHNMQQAGRISDETAFFYMGKLIENGPTQKIFTNPENERTENYISGRFG